MTKALLVVVALSAVVVAFVQQGFLALPPIALATAGLVAGASLGAMERPTRTREVTLPSAVSAVVGTATSASLMAATGTEVLRGSYVASWVLTVVVGVVACGAVALGVGRVLGSR